MKVYVAIQNASYEGYVTLGVFSSKQKALDFLQKEVNFDFYPFKEFEDNDIYGLYNEDCCGVLEFTLDEKDDSN